MTRGHRRLLKKNPPIRRIALVVAPLVTVAAVGTGVAYVIYYALIAEMGATAASFVTYIIPVVGIILGWAILDEHLAWTGFLGMALIVVGVWVSVGRANGNRDSGAGNRESCVPAPNPESRLPS